MAWNAKTTATASRGQVDEHGIAWVPIRAEGRRAGHAQFFEADLRVGSGGMVFGVLLR
ncbi:hypothetical protein ACF073_07420 [Streptomyces sp. NPDC015171]|uniref:hypothetical protein n=1 Tax=Streptomyces sp. NPDC015171 TaxID=3364945 RepID=UPI0037021FDD